MNNFLPRSRWTLTLALLLLFTGQQCSLASRTLQPQDAPKELTIHAPVLLAHPMAFLDEQTGEFRGFQIDLLEHLKHFAAEDGVQLEFELSVAPDTYDGALNLVASDCNTTDNPNLLEDCLAYDLIIGDYWPIPARWERVDFTPAWWSTGFASMKHTPSSSLPNDNQRSISTLEEASRASAKVCVLANSAIVPILQSMFPDLLHHMCGPTVDGCAQDLQDQKCQLFPWDDLTLGYFALHNLDFVMTKERLHTEMIVWPLRRDLNSTTTFLINKWLYVALFRGVLDQLYHKYYSIQLCPIGKAGIDCDQPCDPDHGQSNQRGECVCDSIRFTGEDCATEVPVNLHLIPTPIKVVGHVMFGINVLVVLVCASWLHFHRETEEVVIRQPFFLRLVLLGCLVSSGTIVTLGLEDSGDGPVIGCMLSPWFYSVGFCITFGTLFAKIRRIRVLFDASLTFQRITVTAKDTLMIIGRILLLDITILTVWSIVDPLQWDRTVLLDDIFGNALSSVGQCTCQNWTIFLALIASLHFCLLAFASYLCYGSRHISSKCSEGKFVAIAMISNFQIFVVGLPVLVIVGADPASSYFVRSVIIWMNDFVVMALIFGNLVYCVYSEKIRQNDPEQAQSSVTFDPRSSRKVSIVEQAIQEYRVLRASTGPSGGPSGISEEGEELGVEDGSSSY